MGRASSSKKVNRAAKAGGKPGESSNWPWFVAIGFVVVLGVGLVVASRGGNGTQAASDAPPQVGDHWHAAYGVNVCGTWQPPLQDLAQDVSGIHTHADGLIHLHPFSSRYAGQNANLAAFGEITGLELSDDSLTLPDGETYTNGDECDGEEGEVRVVAWDSPDAEQPREIDEDLAGYAPEQDLEVVTIAFVPVGSEVEKPPTVPRLQDPLAAEEGRQPVPVEGDEVPPVPDDAIVEEEGPDADASAGSDDPAGTDPAAEGAEDEAPTTTAAP